MATATLKMQLTPAKADGTRFVRFRLIYKRQSRYYHTSLVATKDDVYPSGKIKNKRLQIQIDDLLNCYRRQLNELDLDINDSTLDIIYRYLFVKPEVKTYDFISWALDYCEKNKDQPSVSSNYFSALHSFMKFKGNKVLTTEMTTKTMRAFEASLADKKRAVSSYTSAIKRLFTLMCEECNDYDLGDIVIRDTMATYNPPRQNVAQKRALTLEEMRKIFACPYDYQVNKGYTSHHDLALDCFRLSFGLMGINSADLFNACEYDGENIIYNRTKTKARRSDFAEMHVKVQPQMMDLFNKYLDNRNVSHNRTAKKSQKRPIFNFHQRFKDYKALNRAINMGLKEVGEELGIEDLQFYAARHTFATLAANEARISIYLVNDMLCHVDPSLRITTLYIKKNFEPMNDANKQFLDWFFGK